MLYVHCEVFAGENSAGKKIDEASCPQIKRMIDEALEKMDYGDHCVVVIRKEKK